MKSIIVAAITIISVVLAVAGNFSHAIIIAPESFQDEFSAPKEVWHANDDLWKYEDEAFIGQTTDKEQWDRFYACRYYAGGDYEISVKIKQNKVGQWGGGGLIFNSESDGSRNPCMMTRILADRAVIAGYFTSGGSYNEHKAKDIEGGLDKGWHTLKAHVKGNEKEFDVYVDGKLMLEDLPLNYDRGYFGLTICDGNISYKDFAFTQLAPAKPREEFKASKYFGLGSKGEIIGSDMLNSVILFYDKNGRVERQFNVEGGVTTFTSNNRGKIAAFAPNRPLAHIYDEKGKLLGTIDLIAPNGRIITEPSNAFLDDNSYLYILTNEPKALCRFKGRSRPVELPLETAEPDAALVDFSIHGQKLHVVDNKGYVYRYRWHNPPAKPLLLGCFRAGGGGDIRAIASDSRYVYMIERDKVVKYTRDGKKLGVYRGYNLARFSPIALRLDQKGRLYVMDRANDALLQLSSIFTERLPEAEFKSSTSAELSWITHQPSTGVVKLYKDGSFIRTLLDRRIRRRHSVVATELEPHTRYEFSVSPQERAIPPSLAERRHPFLTPAGRGNTQYLNYPIAVFLFTNVIDDEKQKPEWPDTMKPIPIEEVDRFRKEINHACKFYYMNSHMKYNVKPDYYIIDKKYNRSDVFDPGSSYPPKKQLIIDILTENGRKPEEYPGGLYVAATQTYSDETREYYIRGYGGGFTSGTAIKNQGISWWEMTMAEHGAGNDWLMVHEFNHQTDSMMRGSGRREYWFNHYAMLDDNVGKFYWWYNADGYLIRETTPPHWWLNSNRGEIISTTDEDEDGIPDNDPNVWMDEKRMGTDPTKKDTDEDGLTDLEEVLSWNNTDRGWGEDYGGRKIFPDPTNKDSDGDGIIDGEDPYPMFTVKFEIPKASHDIDKPFEPSEWTMLYSLEDPQINYKVYANWDDDCLYIAIDTIKDSMNSIAIDTTTDGWFTGPDNYRFQWGYRGKDFQYELYNCLDPTKFGFNDKELVKEDYSYRFEEKGDRKILLFSLKKNEKTKLMLQQGDIIAIQVISGPAPNPYGWSRYISYFEPNKLMDYKLVEK